MAGVEAPHPPAPSTDRYAAGTLLRGWRDRRRVSQLELSLDTGVSARHISCIETGRAHPSRRMLLRLAAQLDIPLRERNRLLLAAGYAPVYRETSLTDPAMWPARAAIDRLLAAHEPFPALVATAGWRLVAANRPLLWLLQGLPDGLLREPVNVLRLALHPDGLITRVRNPAAWRRYLEARLRHAARASADPELVELEREVRGYPAPDRHAVRDSEPNGLFATIRLRHHDLDLAFITTVATFGTPLDITAAELVIESLYPADPETGRAMADHAHLFPDRRCQLIGRPTIAGNETVPYTRSRRNSNSISGKEV